MLIVLILAAAQKMSAVNTIPAVCRAEPSIAELTVSLAVELPPLGGSLRVRVR